MTRFEYAGKFIDRTIGVPAFVKSRTFGQRACRSRYHTAVRSDGRPEISLLTEAGLPAVLQLQEDLRWNQTKNDWQRLIKLSSQGCFVARDRARTIGTVTTISYGTTLAWIGMMIVHSDFRRRGIGSLLMRTALDHLHREGVATIKLDATAAGRPLYESLGFVPESDIERWEGIATPGSDLRATAIEKSSWEVVRVLDRQAFGADRAELLKCLMEECHVAPQIAFAEDGELRGYALARHGKLASYIGPIVAKDESTAEVLLDSVLHMLVGEKVFIDFHTDFQAGSRILSARGLTKQRNLLRMRFGAARATETSDLVFAIAGPELG